MERGNMKDFNTFTNVNAKESFPPLGGGLGRGGNKKFAFTLAEVLITLGVIGVVAAMTMPTLIQNYQKHETISRLKHFSSVLQQAYSMFEKDVLDGNTVHLYGNEVRALNGEDAEKFFNVYLRPYVKTVKVEVQNKGVFFVLANGSAGYLQRDSFAETSSCAKSTSTAVSCTRIAFCPEQKYCKDIDSKASYMNALDTRHVLAFATSGKPVSPSNKANINHDYLKNACQGTMKHYCAKLIEFDGWKISDDYPW